jgi:hypothetical protein
MTRLFRDTRTFRYSMPFKASIFGTKVIPMIATLSFHENRNLVSTTEFFFSKNGARMWCGKYKKLIRSMGYIGKMV